MNQSLKLYWSPKSPYVRKVMICAHELGVVNRLKLVRAVAAMLKPNPEIMIDNPLSKIPTLVREDGLVLFDSVVICEYLNDLVQGDLFPDQGEAKWQALRWHALADGLLDVLILWRNERERVQPSLDLIAAFELKVRSTLTLLEQEVDALNTVPLNIGTLNVGCALGYLDYRFDGLQWRNVAPALSRWYATLSELDSFQTTQPVDG
jgi:glutathione S-transferase